MIYSLLIVVAIGVLIYWRKRWQKLPESERQQFAKQSALWLAAIVILGLVASGRAHWLMGVLAALLALAGRVAQLAQFAPIFKKMFGDANAASNSDSNPGQAPNTNQMTRQQAADLLGVEVNASDADIRLAHKRLMQKIHPDRGGSDALAKQINLAKDLLIK
ncbi:MAG: flagellar biosynthesis component FlhA [Dinoroseobacter sp.]